MSTQTQYLHINHDHPLVQASAILRRCEKELYFTAREKTQKERMRRFQHREMLARSQDYLAAQIKAEPACWK